MARLETFVALPRRSKLLVIVVSGELRKVLLTANVYIGDHGLEIVGLLHVADTARGGRLPINIAGATTLTPADLRLLSLLLRGWFSLPRPGLCLCQ
jgi:hypothetical protein